MNRMIFRVQWNSKSRVWDVKNGGNLCTTASRKSDAFSLARRLARNHWSRGELAQVVVHKKDGKIQTEWTYGRDPERSKG